MSSDSDEDIENTAMNESINTINSNTSTPGTKRSVGGHLYDIEQLKAQTSQLLDPKWKEESNKKLIYKLLSLDVPTITVKMIDYLLQEGVFETLIRYITRLGSTVPRPSPSDTRDEDMKIAYKAVVLITPDLEPHEQLLQLLQKKTPLMSKLIFECFRDDSAGSFYHIYRILDTLLRVFPTEVYDGISSDGKGCERMAAMLRYIGYPPVNEMFVVLVALTPIARNTQAFNSCSRIRWNFLEQLRDWGLMMNITNVIVNAEKECYCQGYISPEAHSSACAQLMLDMVEKLSLEETGELLLQPLGYDTTILDKFIATATNPALEDNIRRSSCRLLCYFLRRAAEPEVVCIINTAPGQPPQQTCIPNRLYPLRERIVLHIETKLAEIFESVENFRSDFIQTQVVNTIKYSGYIVKVPFTSLRSSLIELIVLMVESDEAVASSISIKLWKYLLSWTVQYGFNSIYHALFYRLMFAVLRQSQEVAQRNLFTNVKFISFLIENYIPFPINNESIPPKSSNDIIINRTAARGLFLNCLNAIRLQAICQAPNTYLRNFLSTNEEWNNFNSTLMRDTEIQQHFGMGIAITNIENANKQNPHNASSLAMLMNEPKPEDIGIEHGSRFARSLGFYDDSSWPDGDIDPEQYELSNEDTFDHGQLNDDENHILDMTQRQLDQMKLSHVEDNDDIELEPEDESHEIEDLESST